MFHLHLLLNLAITLALVNCFVSKSSLVKRVLRDLKPSALDIDATEALNYIKKKASGIPVFNGVNMDDLAVRELPGGNTNFNYVVYDVTHNTPGSMVGVFVKHAKPFAKGMRGESLNYFFMTLY